MKPPVLEFNEVTYRSQDHRLGACNGMSFQLTPGALILIRIHGDHDPIPIADLATGLREPTGGCVRFMERDWVDMDAFEQASARGRMGCVLEQGLWLNNLSVENNVILSERHHTHRPRQVIVDEAKSIAALLGLEGLPGVRPDKVSPRQLRLLEWTRAFLGKPEVVVLAYPELHLPTSAYSGCVKLVEQAMAMGTGIVWLSDREDLFDRVGISPALHYDIINEQWMPVQ